jgi:hypothetical protein
MEYNISGKITLEDYIKFNNFYHRKYRKIVFIIILVFLIIYLLFNLNKYFDNKYLTYDNIEKIEDLTETYNHHFESLFDISPLVIIFEVFLPIITFIILFNFFLFVVDKFLNPIIYKKYFYSNKMLSELQNIKITDINISISSNSSNSILTKDNIYKIIFNKNYIYIYMGLNMVYILKDSFFENINTYNELKLFLSENYM